jgi:hypothetical protein
MNSNYSYGNNGYQPMDNNQYGYENQQYTNNPMSFGPDAYKSKATTSIILGILSLLFILASVLIFLFSFISLGDSLSTGSINVPVIISGIMPVASLTLGIIGICIGASYHKKSKLAGNVSNKTSATIGIVISVISVILSSIVAISCSSCVACVSCFACTAGGLDSDKYSDYEIDEFDSFDDFNFEDYL